MIYENLDENRVAYLNLSLYNATNDFINSIYYIHRIKKFEIKPYNYCEKDQDCRGVTCNIFMGPILAIDKHYLRTWSIENNCESIKQFCNLLQTLQNYLQQILSQYLAVCNTSINRCEIRRR